MLCITCIMVQKWYYLAVSVWVSGGIRGSQGGVISGFVRMASSEIFLSNRRSGRAIHRAVRKSSDQCLTAYHCKVDELDRKYTGVLGAIPFTLAMARTFATGKAIPLVSGAFVGELNHTLRSSQGRQLGYHAGGSLSEREPIQPPLITVSLCNWMHCHTHSNGRKTSTDTPHLL